MVLVQFTKKTCKGEFLSLKKIQEFLFFQIGQETIPLLINNIHEKSIQKQLVMFN